MIRAPTSRRAAFWAGLIAIVVNTALLHLAEVIPLKTEAGGLLKLLKIGFGDLIARSSIGEIWLRLQLPAPDSVIFKTGFHVAVGLAMALFYAAYVEPRLAGSPWRKGLLYACGLWLINAFVLLPWIGEGIAGSRQLSFAGLAYYAVAHTMFFVLLASLYARFRPDGDRALSGRGG